MTHEIVKTNLDLNTHWFLNEINKKPLTDFESCYPNGNDYIFKYKVPFLQSHTDALDNLLLQHDSDFSFPEDEKVLGKDLLIQSVLEERYKNYTFNSVDFKRHLVPSAALNKKVTKMADGRPEKAEYFLDENGQKVLMATIFFYFILDVNGLVSRRSEHLQYEKKQGGKTQAAVIKDKNYDFSNPFDAATVLGERQDGRSSIIAEIKATLLGVLSVANPNLSVLQIVSLGILFFDEKDDLIKHFIELGTEEFKTDLENINLNTTTYTWLLLEVAPSFNLRDYMVSKLTYTAESNHPDA
jgi:hypothetical protein